MFAWPRALWGSRIVPSISTLLTSKSSGYFRRFFRPAAMYGLTSSSSPKYLENEMWLSSVSFVPRKTMTPHWFPYMSVHSILIWDNAKKAVDTFVTASRISLHISPANGTEISTPLTSAPKVGCRGLTEMWWKVGVSELRAMLSAWFRCWICYKN